MTENPFNWIYGRFVDSQLLRSELASQKEMETFLGVADELRIDPLLDLYADQIFPFCTVLTPRAKYYFIAPAVALVAVERTLAIKGIARSRDEFLSECKEQMQWIETLIARQLLLNSNIKQDRIIGSRFFKHQWQDPPKGRGWFYTLEATPDKKMERLGRDKGIQASFAMHAVSRYFRYSLHLFSEQYVSASLTPPSFFLDF